MREYAAHRRATVGIHAPAVTHAGQMAAYGARQIVGTESPAPSTGSARGRLYDANWQGNGRCGGAIECKTPSRDAADCSELIEEAPEHVSRRSAQATEECVGESLLLEVFSDYI